ncbi:LOW QUALITY PROTEIN: shaggy-related protein kinase GSK2-like [Sipha flava]|uniref:LOW QUALITY PROTEIN: shaggy-related protein kinase GSK2-like n=1 Tax=Sipha flava TaxID=143950 RepID=A0A8B8F6D8_9HEMI|nr:LOW QUALITY PROTEIN: shaggy-related protein kinase GSK2-like [Sipha flava]
MHRDGRDDVTAVTGNGDPATTAGDRYRITCVTPLDAGTFGTVYRAVLLGRGSRRPVAVKQTRLPYGRGGRNELDVHTRLRHPNVVRLLFYFYSGNGTFDRRLNLVMELMPTNLDRVIRRYASVGRTVSVSQGKLYAYQMFRGLGYMHGTAGLCHRDVKPRNMLLCPWTDALKLCDFGSAKDLTDGRPNSRYVCSRRYRAPELLFATATHYTTAVDVWSAGCVYAELMTGAPAFPGVSASHQRALVRRPPALRSAAAPRDSVRLVMAALRLDPRSRPTALQACAHECFDVLRSPGRFDGHDQLSSLIVLQRALKNKN